MDTRAHKLLETAQKARLAPAQSLVVMCRSTTIRIDYGWDTKDSQEPRKPKKASKSLKADSFQARKIRMIAAFINLWNPLTTSIFACSARCLHGTTESKIATFEWEKSEKALPFHVLQRPVNRRRS